MSETTSTARDDTMAKRLCSEYLRRRFPTRDVFDMFANTAVRPANREMAFFCAGETGEDMPMRHLSFPTAEDFSKCVERYHPHRVEVGAVWSVRPSMRRLYSPTASRVVRREIAFDLDIDSYDGGKRGRARVCCSGPDWCRACWPVLAHGCALLDDSLRSCVGADRVAWFYSGRRGMHCWVLDEGFTHSDETFREALAEAVAPSLTESVVAAAISGDPYWRRVCEGFVSSSGPATMTPGTQSPYRDGLRRLVSAGVGGDRDTRPLSNKGRGLFLDWYATRHPRCALESIHSSLNAWSSSSSGSTDGDDVARLVIGALDPTTISSVENSLAAFRRTRAFDPSSDVTLFDATATVEARRVSDALEAVRRAAAREIDPWGDHGRTHTFSVAVVDAALAMLLPRIDVEVTRQQNHLLRAPMTVHSDTLRLGIMVERKSLVDFFPTDAPMLKKRSITSDADDNGPVEFVDEQTAKVSFDKFSAWVAELRRCNNKPDDARR